MKNLKFLILIYCFTLLSCQESKTKETEEFTKEQMTSIAQKYGFDSEFTDDIGPNGQLEFKTVVEFEAYMKALAKQRDEELKKHPFKDHHAILQSLKTDRAKIDSMTKWVREGSFHISVTKNKSSESVGNGYNIPADSVELYYWKMKEKRATQ
jgi:hypothetical protein